MQVAPRYQRAGHAQKSVILDEFVAATGYARKYAIQLLAQLPLPVPAAIRQPRAPGYDPAVQAALETAWFAANCVGTKRLIPILHKLVPAFEHHGHLTLTNEVRAQLLTAQPSHRRSVASTRPGERAAAWHLNDEGHSIAQAPDPGARVADGN
ncbi:MAG: hypothetical protein ABIV47_16485 [Roseiflexaceae bacterium]